MPFNLFAYSQSLNACENRSDTSKYPDFLKHISEPPGDSIPLVVCGKVCNEVVVEIGQLAGLIARH